MDFFKLFGEKGIVGSVTDLLKDVGVLKDPEAEAKVAAALKDYELMMQSELSKQMESVNATMRAEAASEKWPQYSWRPMVGFTFGGVIIANYILFPILAGFGMHIAPVTMPGEIWNSMLVILGVAAGFRGWEKVEKTRKGGDK